MEDKIVFTTIIDRCGRFVIPSKVLKNLSWTKGISVSGEVVDNSVIIKSLGNQKICKKCNLKYGSNYKYCPICGGLLEDHE